MQKWGLSHIDKIKGFEHVYKLVSYSTIANWFWVGTSFELIYITRLFMAQLILKKFNKC